MSEAEIARIVLEDGTEYLECPRCTGRSAFGWDVGKRYCATCSIFFDMVTFPDGHIETMRTSTSSGAEGAAAQAI